jgi:GntR family transcriptional regulator
MYEFDANRPIYLQIMDQLKLQIVSGQLPAGSKLASVRDLANEYGVNPNTMQRALIELEREALLYTQRTSGRFVTDNQQVIDFLRLSLATNDIKQLLQRMKNMGFSSADLLNLIKQLLEEMK